MSATDKLPAGEAAVHARIQASTEATSRSRPEPPRSPWEGIRCPHCRADGGGYHGERTVVLALLRAHGWRQAAIADRPVWFCGSDCFIQYNRRAPSQNVPPATLVQPEPAPPPRTAAAPTTRELRLHCSRSGCPQHVIIDQTRSLDGTWSPDAGKLLAAAGWRDGLCSVLCRDIIASDQRMRTLFEPTPKAVTKIDDASYQARRGAVAAPVPGLAGREMPDVKPPKRSK